MAGAFKKGAARDFQKGCLWRAACYTEGVIYLLTSRLMPLPGGLAGAV